MSDATTVADLRNAALVMEHLGYGTEEFVNSGDARVCLDGALQLATTHRLGKIKNVFLETETRGSLMWAALRLHDNGSSIPTLSRRLDNAEQALFAVLPDRCDREGFHDGCQANWSQGYPYADGHGELDDQNRIYHYNDFNCDGGEKAISLLRMAADVIEAGLLTEQPVHA